MYETHTRYPYKLIFVPAIINEPVSMSLRTVGHCMPNNSPALTRSIPSRFTGELGVEASELIFKIYQLTLHSHVV